MTKEINLFSTEQETSQLRKNTPKPVYQPLPIAPPPQDAPSPDEKSTEESRTARSIIEAILFASPEPIPLPKIREAIDPFLPLKPKALESILNSLKEEYIRERRGFRLSETAEGFVLKTPEEMGLFSKTAGAKGSRKQPPKCSPLSCTGSRSRGRKWKPSAA
ncbi:SMC-Scp complex subunit ScpB [Estrella lausannensis]|uniref:Segregation and condensation protein B n=1 Tax=Estrella lausannensis TaxID=483423 RepID=A0A0H5DT37_9BACT|nr:SMC-Scp complex subunit ScpB [Estrella lausannensis]CRX38974.1 conserved hypothetical protein [Estrella lausannensis]